MKKLLILGAGGHGVVILDAALSMKRWDKIFFLDDVQKIPVLDQYQILGKLTEISSFADNDTEVIIGIGDNKRREDIIHECELKGLNLATVIHCSSVISQFAEIQKGCVVFARAVINPKAIIGKGSIVNTAVVIEHDCQLSQCVHVAPGAVVCGNVAVGRLAWIGVGAVIKENITIGENAVVGAGAVVVKNVPDNVVVAGVPAKVIKSL